jgi:hypothetical protein
MTNFIRTALISVRLLAAMGCAAFACTCVADSLSDPTQPPQPHSAAGPKHEFSLRLEAVLADTNGQRAIVAGKLVRVGDRIDGATITNISDDSVHYTVDGHERIAQLNREHIVVKHPSAIDRDSP